MSADSPSVAERPPTKSISKFNPADDGVTHINVYSKAKTPLGRGLSNFANIGLRHPVHGFFSSLEGFWYYIKSGFRHEHLRRLYGFSAKAAGCKLEVVQMDPKEFQDEIRLALTLKVEQCPDLLQAFLENKLPLAHYYVVGQGDKAFPIEKPEHQWQIEHLEQLARKWSAAE